MQEFESSACGNCGAASLIQHGEDYQPDSHVSRGCAMMDPAATAMYAGRRTCRSSVTPSTFWLVLKIDTVAPVTASAAINAPPSPKMTRPVTVERPAP